MIWLAAATFSIAWLIQFTAFLVMRKSYLTQRARAESAELSIKAWMELHHLSETKRMVLAGEIDRLETLLASVQRARWDAGVRETLAHYKGKAH